MLCNCQIDDGMDDVRVLLARLRYCSLDNSPIESGIGPSRSFPAGYLTYWLRMLLLVCCAARARTRIPSMQMTTALGCRQLVM